MTAVQKYLDDMVAKYNSHEFIDADPVQFPLLFKERRDIEIAALIAATIAWGSRKQIVKNCRHILFSMMNGKPYGFVASEAWREISPEQNLHRTFFGKDLIYICTGFWSIYKECDSLEDLFAGTESVWDGIANLRQKFYQANGNQYSKHIPNPQKSACKRLNMMLRWLCRRDGIVDIGIWQRIPTASLIIPLDTHSTRTARNLGLLTRRSVDRKAAELLTNKLKEYCPTDPVKYDFALFGAGEAERHTAKIIDGI
jgi:uncharacterized protein (TIGR02757 family)